METWNKFKSRSCRQETDLKAASLSNENSRSPKKVFSLQSSLARPALDIPLTFLHWRINWSYLTISLSLSLSLFISSESTHIHIHTHIYIHIHTHSHTQIRNSVSVFFLTHTHTQTHTSTFISDMCTHTHTLTLPDRKIYSFSRVYTHKHIKNICTPQSRIISRAS